MQERRRIVGERCLRPFKPLQRVGMPSRALQGDAEAQSRLRIRGIERFGAGETFYRRLERPGLETLQSFVAKRDGRQGSVFPGDASIGGIRLVGGHNFTVSFAPTPRIAPT